MFRVCRITYPLTFCCRHFFIRPSVLVWRKCSPVALGQTDLLLPILWTLGARERFLKLDSAGCHQYSQIIKDSPLAGFAPLGGIHMVTLATVPFSAWLVLLIDNYAV